LPPLLPSLDPGPGIAQRHGPVEDQGTGACVKINTEIALSLELVTTARRSPCETGLKLAPSQHFQGFWIQRLGQISAILVSARVGLEKEVVVQAYLGWNGMRRRDPVNSTLDLASIRCPSTPCGGVVGTAEFHHLACSLILHHPSTGNVIRIAQTHLAARGEAKELPRRVFTKIVVFNVEHARERHLACAHTGFLGIIPALHVFHLAFGIVLNDSPKGTQYRHDALGAFIQILTQAVFKQGNIDDAIALGYTDTLAECPN